NGFNEIRQLAADINAGAVDALFIAGGNPAFDAPADLNMATILNKVPFRAHLSPHYDETSELSHWHVPQTHFLEEWSDTRAHDGTISIVQPLIAPLYNGRSVHDFVGALADEMEDNYGVVRRYWKTKAQA